MPARRKARPGAGIEGSVAIAQAEFGHRGNDSAAGKNETSESRHASWDFIRSQPPPSLRLRFGSSRPAQVKTNAFRVDECRRDRKPSHGQTGTGRNRRQRSASPKAPDPPESRAAISVRTAAQPNVAPRRWAAAISAAIKPARRRPVSLGPSGPNPLPVELPLPAGNPLNPAYPRSNSPIRHRHFLKSLSIQFLITRQNLPR